MLILEQEKHQPLQLEENLKKALTEMIVLFLLAKKDCYIGELTTLIEKKSHGVLTIVFPYGAIYRLQQAEYIMELPKRTAPDGRRRQYYGITESGRKQLNILLDSYKCFSQGIVYLLEEGDSID